MLLATDEHANLTNVYTNYLLLLHAFISAQDLNTATTARSAVDNASEEAFAASRALVLHQQAMHGMVVG